MPKPPKDGPVLIELDSDAPNPAEAPPIDDDLPRGQAMQRAAELAARPGSRLGRFFWGVALAFLALVLSVAAWDFAANMLARSPVLGLLATVLLFLLALAALLLAGREAAAFVRLRRMDVIRNGAEAALVAGDLTGARAVVAQLDALYAPRRELAAARARVTERGPELFDASAVIDLAEAELLAPLDLAARREVEAAARQVAAVTAFVPMALADVAAALFSNMRMIRRVAEIYGGRAGTLGSWRLTKSVLTHLIATGAVAVGDDLIGAAAGGGLLAKLSRRFGEGVVNGALTARVGVAAIDVCRPLPFRTLPHPRTTALISRGLAGLFTNAKGI